MGRDFSQRLSRVRSEWGHGPVPGPAAQRPGLRPHPEGRGFAVGCGFREKQREQDRSRGQWAPREMTLFASPRVFSTQAFSGI